VKYIKNFQFPQFAFLHYITVRGEEERQCPLVRGWVGSRQQQLPEITILCIRLSVWRD